MNGDDLWRLVNVTNSMDRLYYWLSQSINISEKATEDLEN